MVVSDSEYLATNPAALLLAGVNSYTGPDFFFPTAPEQEQSAWLTGIGVLPDPSITDGMFLAYYWLPGNIFTPISLGTPSVRGSICLAGETPLLEACPFPNPLPCFVDCLRGEQRVGQLPVTIMSSETVPTGDPSVEITQIRQGTTTRSVPPNPSGHIALPFHGAVTVRAEFDHLDPLYAEINGQPAVINLGAKTIEASVNIDGRSTSEQIVARVGGASTEVGDSIVARTRKQRLNLHVRVFQDENGTLALPPGVAFKSQFVSGVELRTMCKERPFGLDSWLNVKTDLPLYTPGGYDLRLEVDFDLSPQVEALLEGHNPDGTPSSLIPDPPTTNPPSLTMCGCSSRGLSLVSSQSME